MFKTLLVLATLFTTSAFAAYPDGYCKANQTSFIYEGLISVGSRVQLRNPMFCVGLNEAYAIYAGDDYDDYTSTLCGLFNMGATVNAGRRPVKSEVLAAFDADAKFNGLIEYTSTEQTPYKAVTALVCEVGP